MKTVLAIIAVLALSACASTDKSFNDVYWERNADQPAKQIDVRLVQKGFPLYCTGGALACASVEKDRCTVYVNAKAVHPYERAWVIDHEKCHCAGYDHPKFMVRGYLGVYCPADTHLMPHTISEESLVPTAQ